MEVAIPYNSNNSPTMTRVARPARDVDAGEHDHDLLQLEHDDRDDEDQGPGVDSQSRQTARRRRVPVRWRTDGRTSVDVVAALLMAIGVVSATRVTATMLTPHRPRLLIAVALDAVASVIERRLRFRPGSHSCGDGPRRPAPRPPSPAPCWRRPHGRRSTALPQISSRQPGP